MTWAQFKKKWSGYTGEESSAYVVVASVSDAPASPKAAGTAATTPAIGLARYPRLVPKDADCAVKLKKRTLTNLYTERPSWLNLERAEAKAAQTKKPKTSRGKREDEML
jgi:hypothetical protein